MDIWLNDIDETITVWWRNEDGIIFVFDIDTIFIEKNAGSHSDEEHIEWLKEQWELPAGNGKEDER